MLKKFTVSKKRWARGEDRGCLYRRDRKMCCLGFFCRQIFNKKVDEIYGKPLPNSVGIGRDKLERQIEISMVNDDSLIPERGRIAKLQRIFKEAGYQMEVVE